MKSIDTNSSYRIANSIKNIFRKLYAVVKFKQKIKMKKIRAIYFACNRDWKLSKWEKF